MPLLIPFFSDPAYPAPQSIAILLFLPCNSTTKHLHPSQGPPPGVPSLAFAVPEQKGRHQEQNLDLRSVFQPLQRHRQEATAFLVLTSSSRSAFTQPWSTRLARGWGEKESLSWLYADGNFTHRPLSHTSGDWLAVAKKPRFWSERISPGAHKQAREKKKKKKRVVHTKSSQRQQTCLEKTALIPPLSTSHHFLRTSETATLFFALPSDDALSLSSSQLNPTPRSALSPPCYPFPSPSNLSRYLHCRIGSWMTSPKPARQI